jgi:hypothetical protein
MPDEFVRADKDLRRWLIFALVTLAVVGLLTLKLTQDYLRGLELLSRDDPRQAIDRLIEFIYFVGIAFAAGALATSAYLAWTGLRVLSEQQFPPPGMWVIRDTRIVRGERARVRGYLLCAGALIALAAGVPVFMIGNEIVSTLAALSQAAK